MLLLDTCVLYWLTSDRTRLSPQADQLLHRHANSLHISAISAFEVALNHRKRRVVVPSDPRTWFDEALNRYGIVCLPVTWRIALESAELPPIHNDPADRMIVATAAAHSLTIVTPDSHIRAYSNVTVLW